VVVYAVGIFIESSISQVPELPAGVTDKDAHGLLYGGLGLLILRALSRADWRRVSIATVLTAIVLCAAYGASDEFHQRFVPGRTAELADLAADVLGASAWVGFAWLMAALWRRRRAS
jgi:VanZ family protein